MTTTALILIVLATALYLVWLAHVIRQDGHGRQASSGLPRSHHADAFEAHRFV